MFDNFCTMLHIPVIKQTTFKLEQKVPHRKQIVSTHWPINNNEAPHPALQMASVVVGLISPFLPVISQISHEEMNESFSNLR